MLIQLGDGAAILVSVGAWVLIGFVTGYGWHCVDPARLATDGWLTRPRRWEADGLWYQRRLHIRSWKDKMPEKGDLFRGGFSKRHLTDRSTEHLERFAVETRRAELVHWSNLAAGPLFLIWCPPVIGAGMVAFGVLAHLPLICIQRYNRQRLQAMLRRRRLRA